ncbi:MAG: hypothetical protein Q8S06_02220 [Methanobacteriaceae archaeon]|nr:hypothetical protein [Methanobacteriaceae archaeon]
MLIIGIILLVLFFIGSAAATDITKNDLEDSSIGHNTDYTNHQTINGTNISGDTNSSNKSSNINSTGPQKAKNTIKTESGCCSVLVHVKKGVDVFAYRRDSTYAANLYIKKVKWYGKETIKEYKLVNGYFFHTIISKNGWIVSTGGPDVVWINKKLESLAGKISVKGRITKTDINSAYKILRKLGMGHFLIKDPVGNVGIAIYNSGSSKVKVFKMKDGEYVSVPNSPRFYRQGKYMVKRSNPVSAAIYLAGTDRWGVNRRNIITYKVENINSSTEINVWASYDGGKLVHRNGRGHPDNIIFRGHKIYAKSLPRIMGKKFIGKVTLRNYKTTSVTSSSSMVAKPIRI